MSGDLATGVGPAELVEAARPAVIRSAVIRSAVIRSARDRWTPARGRRLAIMAGLVVFALVLLAAVPGLSELVGAPVQAAVVVATAVALGVAVPLAIRVPPAAMVVVAAVVLGFGQLLPAVLTDGPLAGVELVGLPVLSWVAGQLGLRSRLAVGLPILVGWLLTVVFLLDTDAPLIMLSVGWWVIGMLAQSRRRLQSRLDERVAELDAERDRYATEAVQLERVRIAHDLHDIVAHCMTVVVIQARAGQQLLAEPASVAEAWAAIADGVAEADSDLDALTGIAHPDRVRPLDRAGLDELVRRAERSGNPVQLEIDGSVDLLPAPIGVVAHRIVQEALTNALRYAPGSPIRIELDCRDGLRLSVANAAPQHPGLAELGSGHGLAGLRTRCLELGLGLEWGPDRYGGWRVSVRPA